MTEQFEDLLPKDWNTVSLSDFCNLPIRRFGEHAEVIIAYYLTDKDKLPCRLIGFHTESSKGDFQIYEEAFEYFNLLNQEADKIKE